GCSTPSMSHSTDEIDIVENGYVPVAWNVIGWFAHSVVPAGTTGRTIAIVGASATGADTVTWYGASEPPTGEPIAKCTGVPDVRTTRYVAVPSPTDTRGIA